MGSDFIQLVVHDHELVIRFMIFDLILIPLIVNEPKNTAANNDVWLDQWAPLKTHEDLCSYRVGRSSLLVSRESEHFVWQKHRNRRCHPLQTLDAL